MKLYWSINSIPELADLPKQNLRRVWRSVYLKHWFKIGFLPALIVPICAIAIDTLSENYYGHFGRLICVCIGGGIGGLIGWEITANMIRPYLREYLNSNVKTN
jgi:hypothetical protein